MGFAWTSVVANTAVSSCLAFSSLLKTTQGYSGYFLLHFPSSCLDLPLASTLLCEARTFLKLRFTLNLRPSDQADDYIITRIFDLSIPNFKFFLIFLPDFVQRIYPKPAKNHPKREKPYYSLILKTKECFCIGVCDTLEFTFVHIA